MSGEHVAVRYALALFEAASGAKAVDEVEEDMKVIENLMAAVSGIKRYCREPHDNRAVEAVFIETAFLPYVGGLSGSMLRLLVHNDRLSVLPFVPEAFRRIMDERSEIVHVELETAHEPESGLLALVEGKMRERIGRKLRLTFRVVPELLGGFRILWRNRIVDLSAAGRVRRMRATLRTK